MVNKWANFAQLLWPMAGCVLCGAATPRGSDLCAACGGDLPVNRNACRRCALPLPEGSAAAECGHCLRKAPSFDRSVALFEYARPVSQLITGLKFHQQLHYGRLLGTLMGQRLLAEGDRPEVLIPVPLHPLRLRERGYNQALELARPVAQTLGLPLDIQLCLRSRPTLAQTELPATRRRANVRGAFTLSGACRYRHVALIDDVLTTGHTVGEISQLLKRAGVGRVQVWTCARATMPL